MHVFLREKRHNGESYTDWPGIGPSLGRYEHSGGTAKFPRRKLERNRDTIHFIDRKRILLL
jgi:hypothetical protein